MAMAVKKNKVELKDYSHERDVANRQVLSQLTQDEIVTLQEIVHGSLKTTIEKLAGLLKVEPITLEPLLKKMEEMELLKCDMGTISLNKDMRKYYCCELMRFNNSFEPDLQYLQNLLNKVPIHVLPSWYALPKSTDNIIHSIIEKYFLTPKAYQKHLDELSQELPQIDKLLKMILESENFLLPAKMVMETFKLTHAQFHELILTLEFHLAGCLCYRQSQGRWEECVTLYHEWRQYQIFLKNYSPHEIVNEEEVIRDHPNDFGFVQDLSDYLTHMLKGTLSKKAWPHVPQEMRDEYLQKLISAAHHLKLICIDGEKVTASSQAVADWLGKNKQDQASSVYFVILNHIRKGTDEALGCTERDLREIEKSFRWVAQKNWIYFDEFCRAMTAAIGKHAPVTLVQKGKKWLYALPEYDEAEKQLLYNTIFNHMTAACLVATGKHGQRPCFRLTPYGRMTLS